MYPGTDIIEIKRFDSAVKRQPKLYDRLFTARELANLQGKGIQSYAAHFAGKEAVLKTLGTGLRGLSWHDIEIINEQSGEPVVYLSNKAMELVKARGGLQVRISLAHDNGQAIAFAILF